MKKILFIATLLIATITVNAQDKNDDKGKDLPNGIRAGYQRSTLKSSSKPDFNNLDGFYVGYLRKVKLIPLLRLETGLEYMMAGGKKDETIIKLNYLVLPAQLVLKLGPFYVNAGLNADFRIYENITNDGNKVELTSENRANFFDLSADAGAGFNILFLSIEARYYWGLLDVNDGYKNEYIQLGLKAHF